MRLLTPLLILLASCDPDDGRLDDGYWDAQDVTAASDGLYVRLLKSGGLAHITPEGAVLVDVGPGAVERVALAPDGLTAVAFVKRTRCESDDPRQTRRATYVSDCDPSERRYRTELLTLRGGEIEAANPIGTHFNAVTFSSDARWAIAWLDVSQPVALEGAGVVDLTSVQVLDLQAGSTTPISVGFAASSILFSEDAARAVVLSRDSVALVELDDDSPRRGTVFPLTLEAGQRFDPVGLGLTPDGTHALIAARGRDDLYALRLQPPSINLVNLSAAPAAMHILPPTHPDGDRLTDPLARDDRTILTYRSRAAVELVDHDSFVVDTLDLQSPANRIEALERQAVLWNDDGSRDVFGLDVDRLRTTRFRLQNPPLAVHLSPDAQFAVARTRASGGGGGEGVGDIYANNPGLEVLDLRDDRGRTTPFLLEDLAVGLAFSEGDERLDALVLQRNTPYLLQLDLLSLRQQELRLSETPLAIGNMPSRTGGSWGFWISHAAAFGLISFYEPGSGEITEVSGFAALALHDDVLLEQPEEDR
ncbi:MAG: hypothetical protein EA397_06865 [Deltaproteobacteria bacterium]|nr:MAG: hypothetical protein EA397_06865 [Deltaproteobacteria bacterium]